MAAEPVKFKRELTGCHLLAPCGPSGFPFALLLWGPRREGATLSLFLACGGTSRLAPSGLFPWRLRDGARAAGGQLRRWWAVLGPHAQPGSLALSRPLLRWRQGSGVDPAPAISSLRVSRRGWFQEAAPSSGALAARQAAPEAWHPVCPPCLRLRYPALQAQKHRVPQPGSEEVGVEPCHPVQKKWMLEQPRVSVPGPAREGWGGEQMMARRVLSEQARGATMQACIRGGLASRYFLGLGFSLCPREHSAACTVSAVVLPRGLMSF